jgi:Flp pilus assembly pilin Flp
MSNLILRSASRAQAAHDTASQMLVSYAQGLVERLRREQTGQDMVEYAGVLLIVAAIIAGALALANGIGQTIAHDITTEIGKIFGS